MTLTPDVLSAAASIFSSIVIIFTAIAAFRQISHMRSANEIAAFSAIVERWSAPQTVAGRDFIFASAALMREPEFVAELREWPLPDRPAKLFPVLGLFEEIGTLVQLEIISERAIMMNYASTIQRVWNVTEPAIRVMRQTQGAATYRMFEHLAARAAAWESQHEAVLGRKLETMPDTTRAV